MRVYVFIDYQNLKMSLRKNIKNDDGVVVYRGWDIDMKKFYVYLQDKYKPKQTIVFLGYIREKEYFYQALISYGYRIIFKPVVSNGKLYKGNVDIEIAITALSEIKNYDKAILISGDGDFYSLIKHLSLKEKFYKILVPNRFRYSTLFKEFRSDIVFLENLRRKVGAPH